MASKENGHSRTQERLPAGSTGRNRETDWLAGGGELGELIRSTDWSSSWFGPRNLWPESLRVALDIVVSSRSPMCLFWGPELRLLYNDGYRDIASHKHPSILGRPLREAWPEDYSELAPVFAAVMERGESAGPEDVAKAREAGFDRHIAKPPSLDALEAALATSGTRDP